MRIDPQTLTRKSSLREHAKRSMKATMLVALVTLAGCQKVENDPGLTGLCPEVILTSPLPLAINVDLNPAIIAKFNEPMNPATITEASFTLAIGTEPVSGSVGFQDSSAVFTPDQILLPLTTYTATVKAGVRDMAANAMIADYVWTFTTGIAPDILPPVIISTIPANLATGIELNTLVSADFNELMDGNSISGTTFTLFNGSTQVNGTVGYLGVRATFTPSADLLAGTLYTAHISTAAQDAEGNNMIADYEWTFVTVQPIVIPPVVGPIFAFGVFGGSAGVTNQGLNTMVNNGGLGTTGASTLVTGMHDGFSNEIYTETPLNVGNSTGGIFTAPPFPGDAVSYLIAVAAYNDALRLYNEISPALLPGGVDPGAGELGGLTLAPGIYKSAGGSFNITNGDLTLDANNDPNAIWVFQSATSLTVGIAGPTGARTVHLINGALAKNVYWYVGSAATINGAGGGVMTGNIIASAGVTFSTAGNAVQTVLNGRAISLNASVTLVNTTINVPN